MHSSALPRLHPHFACAHLERALHYCSLVCVDIMRMFFGGFVSVVQFRNIVHAGLLLELYGGSLYGISLAGPRFGCRVNRLLAFVVTTWPDASVHVRAVQ